MEVVLAILVAFGIVAVDHHKAASSPTPPAPTPPAPTPPPPTPPPAATGPGVYPPGTPGTLPIIVSVIGGDGDSRVHVTPGRLDSAGRPIADEVGPSPGSNKTFWFGPGTAVEFQASVDSLGPFGTPFTAFDHFEGPGVSTRQNPIAVRITGAGYVKGVFAFLGRVGG